MAKSKIISASKKYQKKLIKEAEKPVHPSKRRRKKPIRKPTTKKEYIPELDYIEPIKQYIMKLPNQVVTWRKGRKGWSRFYDLEPLKLQLISLLDDYSTSDAKNVHDYFERNMYVIKELIDGFLASSTDEEMQNTLPRLIELINLGDTLPSDAMYYDEINELL